MNLLRYTLRLNSLSCLIFGVLFLFYSIEISSFLGDFPDSLLWSLGIPLIFNGIHLYFVSSRKTISDLEILWFSTGDLLWWFGTYLVLTYTSWISEFRGQMITGFVALLVALLGLIQLWLQGRHRSELDSKSYWKQIGNSWISLPMWVKLWLILLNIIFLLSFLYTKPEIVKIIIFSYITSGPLMLGFAFYEGGLSRIMGIGHLLPWVPMLFGILNLMNDVTKSYSEFIYLCVFYFATIICLGFDVYDLRRWVRGERNIMGYNS